MVRSIVNGNEITPKDIMSATKSIYCYDYVELNVEPICKKSKTTV